ncbi:MAG TPA: HAMP domain-containing sensor histidine kinase [Gaiellaceae bacterium]|nr:HAMP domain-containing sensor histidine kinase [Gaiellaceae bacterium]
MRTGSLRARVIVTTLAVLAIVLTAVVTATTLAYRAKLNGDLRKRLTNAGAAVQRVHASEIKPLVAGLALEGIATHINLPPGEGEPATATAKTGSTLQTRGSLLVLHEVLQDGTQVSFSASRASIDHAVGNLLLVELLVAGAAFAVATLLVFHATRTALRPLAAVIETATRIAHGDTKLRLEPSRTDTELGSLAAAFDRMVDALAAAIEEARASDAATRRFLADASHELRTPIAALQATVETLLREQPERPERDRLEAAVAREGERLGRLVDDLLGLARLEAHPTRTSVDLSRIVRPLVEDAHTRAPGAAITLSADDETTVSGDPDALERVLRNLIDNALAAIRPTGLIEVRLQRRNGHVMARVADDGPGVPDDQRQRIFERFVRLDSSKPGHGLGLAIARRIAQQHHGDLTCDPTATGASFTLRLPTTGP